MLPKPLDEIAKTCIKILLSEPFYGHFMLGMPKTMSREIDTAAVSLMNRQVVKLMVNPEFWQGLNTEHRYGLIKHEVLHIVLKHLLSWKNYPNKKLFNIAADIVVNQYIKPAQLPDGGITLQRFWHLQPMYGITLTPNKDVGYYYHELKKILGQTPQQSFDKTVANHSQPNDSKGYDTSPIDLAKLIAEPNQELERHSLWKEIDDLSPGEQKVMEHQVNNSIRQTVNRVKHKYKNYGNLPAGLKELLDKILEDMKPKFNWRRILRLFAASSNSTYLKNTIRRPSKRYGTTPGLKVKRQHKLLLAIDTSGSVQKEEFLEFFAEIHYMWKQGAEIFIVECDTHIHHKYLYRGVPPTHIHGRGGTAFNAPIQFGNDEYRPDALIYFTDGYALPPTILPRYPILWVISSNGLQAGADDKCGGLQGKILKITH